VKKCISDQAQPETTHAPLAHYRATLADGKIGNLTLGAKDLDKALRLAQLWYEMPSPEYPYGIGVVQVEYLAPVVERPKPSAQDGPKRWRTALTDGRVLEHHFPSGGIEADVRWIGSQFGTVVTIEPVPEQQPEAQPVSLSLALVMACTGFPLTPEQFQAELDADDFTDIESGLIPLETLRAYAEAFSKRLEPVAEDDDRVRCTDCANLIAGKCRAAQDIGVPGQYHPARPELPRRCAAFKKGQQWSVG
jgi:hypothetical protein